MLLFSLAMFGFSVLYSTYLLLHFLYMKLRPRLQDGRHLCFSYDCLPGVVQLYFVAAMQRIYMKKGVFRPHFADEAMTSDKDDVMFRGRSDVTGVFRPPSGEGVAVTGCRMSPTRLNLYREAIGCHGQEDEVPPNFLGAYLTKPILLLGTSDHSRTAVLGTVHVRHTVVIYRLVVSTQYLVSLS